jgi:hypothetical protein
MRWVVCSDLGGSRDRPGAEFPSVDDARADASRALSLDGNGDQAVLSLGVPRKVVDVGEHVLWAASDLD